MDRSRIGSLVPGAHVHQLDAVVANFLGCERYLHPSCLFCAGSCWAQRAQCDALYVCIYINMYLLMYMLLGADGVVFFLMERSGIMDRVP